MYVISIHIGHIGQKVHSPLKMEPVLYFLNNTTKHI